jgi:ribosomal protein S18 acetylase RimI-like enzyme
MGENAMEQINIRKMEQKDKRFIIEMSDRFTEFEFMKWRDPYKMKDAQRILAEEAVTTKDEDSDFFVAEDEKKNLLGFLHMTKHHDYFTGASQGYVSSIAVSKEAEGMGIAKKLMEKAEEWTKSKGYRQLTLNVFASNDRAVKFYSKINFETEIIKMVKEID